MPKPVRSSLLISSLLAYALPMTLRLLMQMRTQLRLLHPQPKHQMQMSSRTSWPNSRVSSHTHPAKQIIKKHVKKNSSIEIRAVLVGSSTSWRENRTSGTASPGLWLGFLKQGLVSPGPLHGTMPNPRTLRTAQSQLLLEKASPSSSLRLPRKSLRKSPRLKQTRAVASACEDDDAEQQCDEHSMTSSASSSSSLLVRRRPWPAEAKTQVVESERRASARRKLDRNGSKRYKNETPSPGRDCEHDVVEECDSDLELTHIGAKMSCVTVPMPMPPQQRMEQQQDCTREPGNVTDVPPRILRDWREKHEPRRLQDLVINKRKVGEIQDWLGAVNQRSLNPSETGRAQVPRVLVLHGPTGCGKTTTLSVLAQEMELDFIHWEFPVGAPSRDLAVLIDDFLHEVQFSNMAFATGPTIKRPPGQRLVVFDSPPWFRSIEQRDRVFALLHEMSFASVVPIVVVLTDLVGASADTREMITLSWASLKNASFVTAVKLNAVPPTSMKKALRQALHKEKLLASEAEVAAACAFAAGDLRALMLALEFQSVNPTGTLPGPASAALPCATLPLTNASLNQRPRKRRKMTSDAGTGDSKAMAVTQFDASSIDSPIGLFHLLGKILRNKRTESGLRKSSANFIMDHLGIDEERFIMLLHANYVDHVGDCSALADLAEQLSFVSLGCAWNDDQHAYAAVRETSALVACEALLTMNAEPAPVVFRALHGSESGIVRRQGAETELLGASWLRELTASFPELRTSAVLTDYTSYRSLVGSQSDAHARSMPSELDASRVAKSIRGLSLTPHFHPGNLERGGVGSSALLAEAVQERSDDLIEEWSDAA
ncbi:Cell cycle checkpoint protein RAD17 [Porphyridium purpureum]|uniref:Cell cycle checkpoint protein RAD17 n=1 Tax=Porphyridium purpureum TaxID=35688 RepID=A0A5J4Z4I7_PORPP|nr:Cell cycle checkpoint protein RAD17 [Porphyridium purpureum]|eukprot:POR0368..scf295_1